MLFIIRQDMPRAANPARYLEVSYRLSIK